MDTKEPNISEKDIEIAPNDITTAAEKALVRKMDFLYVMPFLAMTLFLQVLDKLAINYASVMGIITDTHITNNQFSFVGSVFFIGAFAAQIPTIFLVHKFSVKNYLSVTVILWGTVVALTSFAKNYSQLVGLRFLLGLFESSSSSCCVLIVNRMYSSTQQAKRVNVIVLGSASALTFGGLIGYGIGHMVDIRGLHAWQWLMIIFGSFSTFFGILMLLFMVDEPKSKRLRLTPEQEKIVDRRMLNNNAVVSKKINFGQIKECLQESRFYCYILAGVLVNLQTGSLQTFSSIVISNFGFSNLNAILLGIPSGVIKIAFSITLSWYVDRYGNSHYTMFAACGTEALGILLIIVIPVYRAKIAGLYIAMTSGICMTLVYSSISNNVAGYTKKIVYITCAVGSLNLGSVIGPLLMVDSQKPLYLGAMITYVVADVIAIFLLWTCFHGMSKVNKERLNNPVEKPSGMEDPTDKENPNFIYML